MSRCARLLIGTVLTVLSATAPGCAQNRRLAAPVGPGDILCEVRKIGEGDELPGIWAVSPDGTKRLVIPYGESPVWAPDHRGFAFLRENQLGLADTTNGTVKTMMASVRGGWPAPLGPPYEPRRRLVWVSDTILAGWGMGSSARGESLWACLYCLGGPLWPPDRQVVKGGDCHVGAMGFLSSGKVAAYEALRLVPGLGALDAQVRLVDLANGQSVGVKLVEEASEWSCSPVASPDGQRLAFDVIDKNSLQRGVMVAEAGKWQPVRLKMPSGLKYLHGVEWAPDGRQLLMIGSPSATGLGLNWALLASWSADRQVMSDDPVTTQLSGIMPCHQAVWSPDGKKVAVLAAGGDLPGVLSAQAPPRVVMVTPETNTVASEITFPYHLLPVWIDW